MALTNTTDPEGFRKRKEWAPSTNLNNIIEGRQKRKLTNQAIESTDLPLRKNKEKLPKQSKAKVMLTFQGTQLAQGGSSWHPSMEIEEVNDKASLVQHALPINPTHILEPAAVDSGNSKDDILRDKTANGCANDDIVEEPAECAEVELGKSFSQLCVMASPSDKTNRAPCKRLDLPNLCVLQANPEH